MRYLGLDLGTKTLGIAISDKTNTIATFYKVLKYNEDMMELILPLKEIILEEKITEVALGLPKNMDNSCGFAVERSLKFKKIFEENIIGVKVNLVDERLTTVEATNYLLEQDVSRKKRKKIVDGVAASIILDTFLKMKGD